MKRLYVSDVDNTLLSENHNKFSNEFKTLICEIQKNASQFVMCSGSPTINLVEMAKELNVGLKYVSGYNGVELFELEKGKVLKNHGLSKSEVEHICSILDEDKYCYMIYDKNILRTNIPNNKWVKRESELCKIPIGI